MKIFPIVLCTFFLTVAARSQPKSFALDPLQISRVPNATYRVNFQRQGREMIVHLRVADSVARQTGSAEPDQTGLSGQFEFIGNGVFMVTLRNSTHTATQFWVFKPDGTASVKEVPDRGEKQVAVPIPFAESGR